METPKRAKSIIKPESRVEASPLGEEVDLAGKYSLAIMTKSGIEDNQEANQLLLDGFKIQEDVKMYIQLPDYGDFRGFYLANESDLAAISKRGYEGFARPSRPTLKHHLLTIRFRINCFAP